MEAQFKDTNHNFQYLSKLYIANKLLDLVILGHNIHQNSVSKSRKEQLGW